MRNLVRSHRIAMLTIAFVALSAGPVLADAGLQVLVQPWDPHNSASGQAQSVLDDPHFFDRNVAKVWSDARDPICAQLKTILGKPDLIGKGMSLYNIDCAMGATGVLTVSQPKSTEKRFVMVFHVGGNGVTATSTQPTVLGSYADPRFSVAYDLDAYVDATILPLTANSVKIVVSNASIDSHNLSADILKTLDAFFKLGYLVTAQNAIDQTKKLDVAAFNSALAQANGPLMQYASQYAYANFWWSKSRIIADFAPVFPSTPRTSVAGGKIRWTKSSEIAIDDCSHFTMSSIAQTGPAPLTYPLSSYGEAPTVPGLGVFAASGAPIDAGDHFECAYTLSQLPAALPESMSAGAQGHAPITGGNRMTGYFVLAMSHSAWQDGVSIDGRKDGLDWDVAVAHVGGGGAVRGGYRRYNPVDPASRAIDTSRYESGANSVRGIDLVRSGDLVGAEAHFATLAHENPRDASALLNLALVHIAQGQSPLAKTELASASRLANASGNAALAGKIDTQLRALGGAAIQLRGGSVIISH